MPCYTPIKAWKSKELTENGKRKIVFRPQEAYNDLKIDIPCGQCIGCRLERSRQWAIRCMHETKLHDRNCFVTLTYHDEPEGGSLNVRDIQLFFKRLRKAYGKVRYLQCGEYGKKFSRPHHHAILFGIDFYEDRKLWRNDGNNKLFTSEILDGIWGLGYCIIGEVTFESCSYVSGYITKKVTGKQSVNHYNGRKPEYITMSRRPGIGKEFYDKFKEDFYKLDKVIIRNDIKIKPPKYYDAMYELEEPQKMEKIKKERRLRAKTSLDTTYDRRKTINEHKNLTLAKRSYENGK